MLPRTGNFQRLTTWRQVYTQVGVSEWVRLRGAWQMKAGECVCDISVRVCVSVPGQLFPLTTPHVWALRWCIPSLGISSMAARSNGAPGGTGGGWWWSTTSKQTGPIVGAGFLSSAHHHSPDGLCIERESEGRAALTGWTRTVTRPQGLACCCVGQDWGLLLGKCVSSCMTTWIIPFSLSSTNTTRGFTDYYRIITDPINGYNIKQVYTKCAPSHL